MKKLLIVLLAICIVMTITACANSIGPAADDTVNDAIPSIDRYEVDAIIMQYDNSGQYFLSAQEITEFAELYNQPESFSTNTQEREVAEAYVIVITYTNGDYLLIDKYDDAEYDFTAAEYEEVDAAHKSNVKFYIKNSPLAAFTDKLVQEQFLAK